MIATAKARSSALSLHLLKSVDVAITRNIFGGESNNDLRVRRCLFLRARERPIFGSVLGGWIAS